nr:hypothetical protein [Tanacetum cinerariifolium]
GEPGQRRCHRRRSAAALARSAARLGQPGHLHSDRRGTRHDPCARQMGTGRGLPPAGRLARRRAGIPGPAVDQPVGTPAGRAGH